MNMCAAGVFGRPAAMREVKRASGDLEELAAEEKRLKTAHGGEMKKH